MKLVTRNASIAAAVEVIYKAIHQIEKAVFMNIVVDTVQPVDLIAPYQFVMVNQRIVPGTGSKQFIPGMQRGNIIYQARCQHFADEVFTVPILVAR